MLLAHVRGCCSRWQCPSPGQPEVCPGGPLSGCVLELQVGSHQSSPAFAAQDSGLSVGDGPGAEPYLQASAAKTVCPVTLDKGLFAVKPSSVSAGEGQMVLPDQVPPMPTSTQACRCMLGLESDGPGPCVGGRPTAIGQEAWPSPTPSLLYSASWRHC